MNNDRETKRVWAGSILGIIHIHQGFYLGWGMGLGKKWHTGCYDLITCVRFDLQWDRDMRGEHC